jgi:uncharacterized membrane protein
MTEETFVQLFWAIALPTMIMLIFVLAGAVHHSLEDPAIRHIRKLEAARKAWAKMLEDDRHETKA